MGLRDRRAGWVWDNPYKRKGLTTMRITIEGERTEGKTTLMLLLAHLLSKEYNCSVSVGLSRSILGSHNLEESVGLYPLQPREIHLVEKNSSEEVWDGMIKVEDLGKVRYNSGL